MRGVAAAFLLDPARDVGRSIFDGDLPGVHAAQKHHPGAVYEGDVRQVQRDSMVVRASRCQSLLDFGNVLAGELPVKMYPDGLFLNARDYLQHILVTPVGITPPEVLHAVCQRISVLLTAGACRVCSPACP